MNTEYVKASTGFTYIGDTQPTTDLRNYDTWLDTGSSPGKWMVYVSASWGTITTIIGVWGPLGITTEKRPKRNVWSYVQDTRPQTGMKTGDIWYNTSNDQIYAFADNGFWYMGDVTF